MYLSLRTQNLLVTPEWQHEQHFKEEDQAAVTWGKNLGQALELAGDQSLTCTWDLTEAHEESSWRVLGTGAGIFDCSRFPPEQVLIYAQSRCCLS